MLCRKQNKNSVFSRAQLLCITKWHFCNQKCHLGFSRVPAEKAVFVVFGDFVWLQKSTIFQKQIVSTRMCIFTFRTQIVFACFSKKCHFNKKSFLFTTTPKTQFSVFFWKCSFSRFLISSLFLSPTEKDKNKKCIFLESPSLTPRQTAKKNRTPTHHFKIPKSRIKLGKNK